MKQICILISLIAIILTCQVPIQAADIPDFPWMKEVGAKTFPTNDSIFHTADYGAVGDALHMNTEAIQKAIDEAEAAGGGTVTFEPGIFLTGALFIGNNVNLCIPKGTIIIGSQELKDYRRIPTRVAGIEMEWPSALINVIGKKNAAITGNGTIHCQGKVFWDKYWKLRNEYTPKGLRWIVDYDCERPRGILISESEQITVRDIVLYQPGFWSLHILYCQHVTVDNIIISNNIEGKGPSTDGIDIDSSEYILVRNSNINCNDDNFCLKAGRDADGLRVNRPCQYIVIRDCKAGLGGGLLTCGSETSGGIRHIVVYRMNGEGTTNGIHFKSTPQRGGCIEDIYLHDIKMKNVKRPLVVDMNWHPAYSTNKLPDGYNPDSIPSHWKTLLLPVNEKQGRPVIRNIHFSDIQADNALSCIQATGLKQSPVTGFTFNNVTLRGKRQGRQQYCKEWDMSGLSVDTDE